MHIVDAGFNSGSLDMWTKQAKEQRRSQRASTAIR